MIVDKIYNWNLYFRKPVFKLLFEQLENYDIDTPNGTYKNHDSYYFKVMSYDTKLEPSIIESHKKEVDVQILLLGSEHIKIYNAKDVEVIQEYDKDSDCQFYKPINASLASIDLRPSYMAVFFPEDIHRPQYAVNNRIESLKKIVIKIDETLFA